MNVERAGHYSCNVKILKKGYVDVVSDTQMRADATVTLIKGSVNVIVDTGNPCAGAGIVQALGDEGLAPDEIDFVVCTHGHTDHCGNNGLFPHATFIVGHDVSKDDLFTYHNFVDGPYVIDENIRVVATRGHTKFDVSVIVKTEKGIIGIVGDLFFTRDCLIRDDAWHPLSEYPEDQKKNQEKTLKMVDYIIPGHDDIFKVP